VSIIVTATKQSLFDGRRDVDRLRQRIGNGFGQLFRRQVFPVHVPLGEAGQPVALLGVPGVDGVRRARAPEERRMLADEPYPKIAADAFALRLAVDGEL